jgi:predicted GTPase
MVIGETGAGKSANLDVLFEVCVGAQKKKV